MDLAQRWQVATTFLAGATLVGPDAQPHIISGNRPTSTHVTASLPSLLQWRNWHAITGAFTTFILIFTLLLHNLESQGCGGGHPSQQTAAVSANGFPFKPIYYLMWTTSNSSTRSGFSNPGIPDRKLPQIQAKVRKEKTDIIPRGRESTAGPQRWEEWRWRDTNSPWYTWLTRHTTVPSVPSKNLQWKPDP